MWILIIIGIFVYFDITSRLNAINYHLSEIEKTNNDIMQNIANIEDVARDYSEIHNLAETANDKRNFESNMY